MPWLGSVLRVQRPRPGTVQRQRDRSTALSHRLPPQPPPGRAARPRPAGLPSRPSALLTGHPCPHPSGQARLGARSLAKPRRRRRGGPGWVPAKLIAMQLGACSRATPVRTTQAWRLGRQDARLGCGQAVSGDAQVPGRQAVPGLGADRLRDSLASLSTPRYPQDCPPAHSPLGDSRGGSSGRGGSAGTGGSGGPAGAGGLVILLGARLGGAAVVPDPLEPPAHAALFAPPPQNGHRAARSRARGMRFASRIFRANAQETCACAET